MGYPYSVECWWQRERILHLPDVVVFEQNQVASDSAKG